MKSAAKPEVARSLAEELSSAFGSYCAHPWPDLPATCTAIEARIHRTVARAAANVLNPLDSSRIDTNGSFYAVYRLDYRCATGKSLEVTWRVGEDHGAGANLCDVRVASVTLQ